MKNWPEEFERRGMSSNLPHLLEECDVCGDSWFAETSEHINEKMLAGLLVVLFSGPAAAGCHAVH